MPAAANSKHPAFYHPQIENMGREEMRALQLRRLKAQLARCYKASPFYREKWKAAGISPSNIRTLEDARNIPIVTKEDLRGEQAAYPPFGRFAVAPSKDWREVHPSSGTTGLAINTLWTEQDVRNITDFTARTSWQFGLRPGDIVLNGFSYGLWVAGLAVHYACRKLGCLCLPVGGTNTQRLIDYMSNPGATVLICTPSYALHIAEKLREAGISPDRIPLRLGCFGGEAGAEADATRQRIEQGLGIEAFDYYGLAEINPTFASECQEKRGIHWAEDHHLIEVLDPATKQPVKEGEIGVLTITNLTKQGTPMVRYWTNDYARLDTTCCACGRTSARSPGGIMGRADDLVIYRGTKFYPVQVERVIRSHPGLSDEFVIEMGTNPQTNADTCTVVAEYQKGSGDVAALTEELKYHLRDEIQVTPEIRLVPFGTLERTTFKAKRLLDKRPRQAVVR